MASALTLETMSPGLLKGVERAQREPEGRFHALAQLIDMPALERAYRRQRADAAVGMDGVTKEQYGQALEVNLQDLHARLKAQRYRHQPIRRVHIPKAQGKTRPIGISAFEDKVVQDAVREVLEAIYEQDFLGCSYGFRPGRSAHDAVRTLEQMVHQGEVRWIFEADIVSFFDSLDRTELKKMLEVRVADGSLLRLIGKCLHVGVLDGEAVLEPELGTVQGSVLSPLLGNVYLHYVLDRWFETEVKPRLRGKATLIRYCDDFIIGFEREDDAGRVRAVLEKRLGRFGLTLHPDKTRLLPFWRPSTTQQSVPTPSASAGEGTARRARSTFARPLQLLRRQRQLSESVAACRSNEAGLVQVVVPSQPAQASHVGEVYGSPPTDASSPPTDHGPDLGCVTTSHINGRAGWWKSPCPDLARGRGGQPPGLLYNKARAHSPIFGYTYKGKCKENL